MFWRLMLDLPLGALFPIHFGNYFAINGTQTAARYSVAAIWFTWTNQIKTIYFLALWLVVNRPQTRSRLGPIQNRWHDKKPDKFQTFQHVNCKYFSQKQPKWKCWHVKSPLWCCNPVNDSEMIKVVSRFLKWINPKQVEIWN